MICGWPRNPPTIVLRRCKKLSAVWVQTWSCWVSMVSGRIFMFTLLQVSKASLSKVSRSFTRFPTFPAGDWYAFLWKHSVDYLVKMKGTDVPRVSCSPCWVTYKFGPVCVCVIFSLKWTPQENHGWSIGLMLKVIHPQHRGWVDHVCWVLCGDFAMLAGCWLHHLDFPCLDIFMSRCFGWCHTHSQSTMYRCFDETHITLWMIDLCFPLLSIIS